MCNVIYANFPNKQKRNLPRKRVFYLGQYYAGPPLCHSLEKLWIKRKPDNRWVFLQYQCGKAYELEEYDGDDLLAALECVPLADEVTIDDLLEMGWYHSGEVIKITSNIKEKDDEA